ncbi:MAG TPA: bifunctional phosphoribosylaminoimidazolecarboxamide formyltransferase/IMP cyclohydrolase, partial [Beutenbergiaceae bacterium]|nr:bifunctional phosphoribosylaminoimidazolecarboxamide formyltransferase/IMP cyclohydrolase [Beutenbergiaceae bacterium]
MSQRHPIQRALVSVYDKSGLTDLATGLHQAGVEIVSTGSTAAKISEAGIPVTPVETLTQFPECLDGRVKTLHPRVHAGILADRTQAEHTQQLHELNIAPFDLVVVNLYPFSETVASGAGVKECIEKIDIGGPAMVRAAAKNHASLAVVVNPQTYPDLLEALNNGGFTLGQRQQLAAEAFRHTAAYDVAVASWMGEQFPDSHAEHPSWLGQAWDRVHVLRYGENPHQNAALYTSGEDGLARAEQVHGKEMSYNNYVDADAAWHAAHNHGEQPTVAVIKHANPCGIAVGETIAQAHAKAHDTDPVSAFGGVIAANGVVTKEMADQVAKVFTEVILAPEYEPAALEVLKDRKNLRILTVATPPGQTRQIRQIHGGLLVQSPDTFQAE